MNGKEYQDLSRLVSLLKKFYHTFLSWYIGMRKRLFTV